MLDKPFIYNVYYDCKGNLLCELNDIYGKLLTSKQTDMIRQFYDDDFSLGEIAENEGITRQAAHDAITKGVSALRGYEAALGLMLIRSRLKAIDETMSKERILTEIKNILGE